jgi:uncharacterized protein
MFLGGTVADQVVHFEVMTGGDAAPLQRFYADAFGWDIDTNNPGNYGMVQSVGANLSGGIGASLDGSSHVTVYIGVQDLDAAIAKIESLGGKVAFGPMEVPPIKFAHILDPAGNKLGLSQPIEGGSS